MARPAHGTVGRALAVFLAAGAVLAVSKLAAAGVPSDALLIQEIDRGEYERSVADLRRESELVPLEKPLRAKLAQAYARISQREMAHGRYPEAASYLARAEELLPDETDPLQMQGVARPDAALPNQGEAVFPDRTDLIHKRGLALYLAKEYDSARTQFDRVPDDVTSLFYLGRISYDTGDLRGAVATWRRALGLGPGNHAVKEFLEKAERELAVESRMDKGYSSMFDISFDAELLSGLSSDVLDALEAAYAGVGEDFGLFPNRRIPVVLYTKSDYKAVTHGPDWSGGLYDGKIRLPVGGVTKITSRMRAALFHEYTHVVIAEMTDNNIPTWLNEGLAEQEGRREFDPARGVAAHEAKRGKLLGLQTLTGSFLDMGGHDAGLAYEQSYSMVHYLVSAYGWQAVRDILKVLGEKGSVEQAFRKGLESWGLDLPGFYEQWKTTVSNQQAD